MSRWRRVVLAIYLFIAEGGIAMAFELSSPAFKQGEAIPTRYTCDGKDVSPPLSWKDVPEKTQILALIADDPDAPVGTWVHWVLYHVPASARTLAENVPKTETLSDGSRQGVNDFGKPGYGGPCPPRGTHHYFFKLYALDFAPALAPHATKHQLEAAMNGHILAEAQLMGTYQRH